MGAAEGLLTSRNLIPRRVATFGNRACLRRSRPGRRTHETQIPLHAIANAPLRSGFVENIYANGPKVFAHEVYVVNGALPNTTFQVSIAVSLNDPTCTAAPVSLGTATLTTNAAGNAKGQVFFTPEGAAFLRHASHGAIWTLSTGGGRDLPDGLHRDRPGLTCTG